ncbi:MAG TPA: amidohydrolase family protein [Thermoanaerobaculia bacterium]
MWIWRLVALLAVLAPLVTRADAPGVYALTGATVHPASGPVIPTGIVVVRGGLIEAVGANVTIPPDATIIDVTGSHVYPGLIDAHTTIGFPATPATGRDRPAEPGPETVAIRSVNISTEEADARRSTGVTTVITAPARGIFNGQSVVMNLGSGTRESHVIRNPAALQITFNTRSMWTYPDSLMGVVAFLRQTFLDARQHAAAHEVYGRTPTGLRRPPDDPALEALGPALRREVPVVFVADSESMIRRVQTLAGEFNLRAIVSGAREAYAIADELKNVPVLVSVRWPEAPTDREDREDQPLRLIRQRQLAPTTPAALAKSGVTFALVSGSGKAGDFLPGIRKAMENGLTHDEALRATTIAPARIFGFERQLGSIERGKIANLVVSDRRIFEKDAKVTRLFVDGREIRLPREDAAPGISAASPIDGSWAVTVRTPGGNVSMQVTLKAEAGRLSGSWSGDRGSGDIRSGTFEGSSFEFTISAAQNDAEMSDWAFRGTLDGETMNGTVATTLGNFEFSGSKAK